MGFKPCLKPHQLKMAINLPYYSIPRTFQVPPGYSILNLNTNNFTDPVINNLYTRFACCFGERINSINQARKKGKVCKIVSDTKYLLMALYVLRNWFNPVSKLPSISINVGGNVPADYNFYIVGADLITSVILPIGESYGNTFAQKLTTLQSSLSSSFTAIADANNANNILITSTIPNMNMWIYWTETITHSHGWVQFTGNTFNPCLTPQQVALIIERCFKICGCQNCNNVKVMEEDNTYIPFGQPNPPSLPLQTYLTSPIYNVKPGEFPCINPYWS